MKTLTLIILSLAFMGSATKESNHSINLKNNVASEYFYFDAGCDESFEKHPLYSNDDADYTRQYVYIVSNVFSCNECDYNNNYGGAIEQFGDALGARYKTANRCVVNSHALEGPFDTREEAEKARRKTLSNHNYDDDKVFQFSFSYY